MDCLKDIITRNIFHRPLFHTLKSFHRWARLLKQQSSFIVYHLPTEEKQTSVFCFPFAANKRKFGVETNKQKLPFSIISIYCTFYIYGKRNYKYVYASISNGKRKPRQFSFYPLTVHICSSCKTDVCCLPVC